MKTLIKMSFVLIALVVLASCEKSETYPKGGDLADAETYLTKNWYLDSYFRDNVNETNLVLISDLTENYNSQGVYARSYIKADQAQVAEDGTYSFTTDKYELRISDVSSISDFSAQNSTLSSSAYQILKLTETEFWYSFVNGGESHEFRFSSVKASM